MTDPQLHSLLLDATADLAPDVGCIVGEGVARGRRRVRRRTLATGGAAAVLVMAVVAGALLADGQGARRAVDLDVAVTPSAPVIPEARKLSANSGQLVAIFTELVGGTFTPRPQKEPGLPHVEFLWKGFATTIGFSSPQAQAGWDADLNPNPVVPRTAMERCLAERELEDGVRCQAGDRGNAFRAWSDKPRFSAVITNFVTVFTADGWRITLVISNAEDKEGAVLADRPPLTLQQMVAIAENDRWFE